MKLFVTLVCSVIVAIFAPVVSANDTTACEHKDLKISCPAGLKIIVKSASYGRQDKETCGDAGLPVDNTNCLAKTSLEKVKSACEDKKSCSVRADNGVFGDPCVGTYKYLTVNYECAVCSGNEAIQELGPVCERKNLGVTCPAGEVIRITYASYGRQGNGTPLCPGPVKKTLCHAKNSLTKAQEACDGKQSCSISSSNGYFGDPCVGTTKYLNVRYICC